MTSSFHNSTVYYHYYEHLSRPFYMLDGIQISILIYSIYFVRFFNHLYMHRNILLSFYFKIKAAYFFFPKNTFGLSQTTQTKTFFFSVLISLQPLKWLLVARLCLCISMDLCLYRYESWLAYIQITRSRVKRKYVYLLI